MWYDPTLGHSHLREFLSGMQPFCLIHHIGAHLSWSRVEFLDDYYVGAYSSQLMMDFESWSFLGGDRTFFFSHWSMRCWREISFDMLILGHTLLINDWFWRYFFYLRFAYFERMYSYWGIATLLILEIETWPSVYDCYFRWIIEIMIFFSSIFLAHLVWFDYPLTLVGHPNILPLIPLYLHLSCQSLAYLLLSPHIWSSYMTLSPYFDQRRI